MTQEQIEFVAKRICKYLGKSENGWREFIHAAKIALASQKALRDLDNDEPTFVINN